MNYVRLVLFSMLVLFFANCNAQEEEKIESQFLSFDKTKIVFTDEGKGEAVILIHGFIMNASHWKRTLLREALLAGGFRVIIPDLRGNGKSDRPENKEFYMHDAEIKDIMKLADHLKLDNYSAIGYSRGSIVLAKLLTTDSRISKAVLGGMGLDFTKPNWNRRIAFADAFMGRVALDDMTRGAVEYAKSIDANIKALGYLQNYQPVTSIEELSGIKAKVLVIAGDQDTDNGSAEDLQREIPNSKFEIVDGDHNNTYKQENFTQVVMDFMSEK